MEDTFLGPRKPGGPGRGAKGKAKIGVAAESRGDHSGFAVMTRVPAVSYAQILGLSRDKVAPKTRIRTDGRHAYWALASHGFVHEPLMISKDKEALKQLRSVHVWLPTSKGTYAVSTTVSVRSI